MVTKKHKPARPRRNRPAFSPAQWLAFSEALLRVKTALKSHELAVRDVVGHMSKGQLASAIRRIGRDGSETFELLKPSFWEGATFNMRTSKIEVRNLNKVTGSRGWFFVARVDLDRLYPAAAGAPVAANTDNIPRRARSGPKPRDDWPTVLAAWLIAVTRDDPKRLRNVDALVPEAQDFLEEQIEWAPKETKDVRKKIVELLQFVSRD